VALEPTRVMFVCLGNICRLPTAHGVFQTLVDAQNLGDLVQVSSSGTGDWNIGHAPDERASNGLLQEICRARAVQ